MRTGWALSLLRKGGRLTPDRTHIGDCTLAAFQGEHEPVLQGAEPAKAGWQLGHQAAARFGFRFSAPL
ncbi:hypothetical protein ACGFZH_22690 [Streptomyces zaomyceticus]|uniref:hypothetical protein n=1 Tax=Streptomyces zaomyceticus TaxID=68286 RepID=UPI003711E9AC